jgi:hypothetical protein
MKIDYRALILGVQCKKKTVFPFSSQTIYIRVLSEYDLQEAARKADEEYSKRNIGLHNVDERTEYKTMYELYLSIVDEDGLPVFPSFEDLSKACTPEIAKRLSEEQNTFQAEQSPSMVELTDVQLDEIVDELKKNLGVLQTISDSRILRKLIQYLVCRV